MRRACIRRTPTGRATTGGRAQLAWQPNGRWTVIGNFVQQDTKGGRFRNIIFPVSAIWSGRTICSSRIPMRSGRPWHHNRRNARWARAWFRTTSDDSRHIRDRFDASLAWPQLTGFPEGPSPFDFERKILIAHA